VSRSNDPPSSGETSTYHGADLLDSELRVPIIQTLVSNLSPPEPNTIVIPSYELSWSQKQLTVTAIESGDVTVLGAGDIDGLQLSRVIHRPVRTAWQRFLGRQAREALFLHAILRNRHGFELRLQACLLYTSPSPRDRTRSRMPSSA